MRVFLVTRAGEVNKTTRSDRVRELRLHVKLQNAAVRLNGVERAIVTHRGALAAADDVDRGPDAEDRGDRRDPAKRHHEFGFLKRPQRVERKEDIHPGPHQMHLFPLRPRNLLLRVLDIAPDDGKHIERDENARETRDRVRIHPDPAPEPVNRVLFHHRHFNDRIERGNDVADKRSEEVNERESDHPPAKRLMRLHQFPKGLPCHALDPGRARRDHDRFRHQDPCHDA